MMIVAALRILLLVLALLLVVPPAWLVKKLGRQRWADAMFRMLARLFLRIAGVRWKVRGQLSSQRPLLVVTNHLSYMDIPILAASQTLRFLPKSEISGWPVLGWMCRINRAVFIDRRADKLLENSTNIRAELAAGQPVCLFPEGTTGNGLKLLPFKSSFFSLAEEQLNEQDVMVQPAVVAYQRIHNLPIDITQWPFVAWYGDMTLVPHLWNLLQMTPLSAEVIFLEPVAMSRFTSRKELAQYCQDVIAQELIDGKN